MTESTSLSASSSEAFVATARAKYATPVDSGNAAMDMLVLLSTLYQNPAVDRATLRGAVIDHRTTRDKIQVEGRRDLLYDPADLAQTALTGLKFISSALPVLGGAAGALGMLVLDRVVEHGRDVVTLPSVQDTIKGSRNRLAADAKAEVADQAAGLLPWTAQRLHEKARANPELAAAMADVLPELNVDDVASTGQCVTNHPEVFSAYPSIVVQADNSVVIAALEQLRSEVMQELNGVTLTVTDEIGNLGTDLASVNDSLHILSGDVAGIRVYIEEQQRSEAEQRAAAEVLRIRSEAKARWEAVFAGAQGAVAGVSAVADLLGEPKLAGDIRRYGGGALQLAQSTVQAVQAVSALATGLSLVSSLGAAAATGNLLGAVASLVSLWQPKQPDPSQLILQEISGLRDALGQLSDQLSTGLSHIDQRLAESHATTMTVLSELVAGQRRTYEEIVEIRTQIVTQQRLLEGVVTSMRSYFQASARNGLYGAVNAGLDYASRNSGPMTQAEHNSFASTYYTWATNAAFDAINQPGGSTADADLVLTLGTGITTDHFSLVNQSLAARGLSYAIEPGTASKVADLPNLEVWSIAAAAYAQLKVQWPLLADRDDERSTEIQVVGRRVLSSIAALSQNIDVFDSLANRYLNRIADLSDGIGRSVAAYHHDHLPAQLGLQVQEIAGLDLFAHTPTQPGQYRLRFPETFDPGGGGPLLAVPPSLATLPLSVYGVDNLLAQDGRNGPTRFGVRWGHCTSFYIEKEVFPPKGGDPFIRRIYGGICYLDVTYDNIKVATVTQSQQTGTREVEGWFRKNWNTVQGIGFQQVPLKPAETAAAAAVLASTTQRVETALDEHRRRACGWIDTQLQPGGDLRPLLQNVGGSQALLSVLIKLTFPIAARSDDLLRELLDGGVPWSAGGCRVPGSNDLSISDLYQARSALPGLTPSDWVIGAANVATTHLRKRLRECQRSAAGGEGTNRQDLLTEPLLRLEAADMVVAWANVVHDQRAADHRLMTTKQQGVIITVPYALVRFGPGRQHDIVAKPTPRTTLTTQGFTDSGQLINGSARWYRLESNSPAWVHSSGGRYEPAASSASGSTDKSGAT